MGSRLRRPVLSHSRLHAVAAATLAVVVGLAPSFAVAAAPEKPKNSRARRHYETANTLYDRKEYERAAIEARKGLAVEENVYLVWILANSERFLGNCIEAVPLYDRFLEMTDSESARKSALHNKSVCADALVEQARQAEREKQELLEEEEEEPLEEEPLEEEPLEEEPPVEDDVEPARPWYRDPLGGVLVGIGGATLVGGGVTLLVASQRNPNRAGDYGEFDELRALQPELFRAGIITASVGAVILAGGALRWGLLARRDKRARQEQEAKRPAARGRASARVGVGPWLDRTNGGLVVRGRF